VVHDDGGVFVSALAGELVDANEEESLKSLRVEVSLTTRPAIRPTVTQEMRKRLLTVLLPVIRVNPTA
jgi:hypothetical protein